MEREGTGRTHARVYSLPPLSPWSLPPSPSSSSSSSVDLKYIHDWKGSLTVANVLKNNLDIESAKLLVDAVKDKDVSLCGIQRNQTTADFSARSLKPPDAVLLASDLSKAGVSASLTALDVRYNTLSNEGEALLQQAVQGRSGFKLMM